MARTKRRRSCIKIGRPRLQLFEGGIAMSKVTVPVEVARAITLMRKEGATNYEIIHRANGALLTEPDVVLRRWAFGEHAPANPDMLMSALINGYEIEKTPEDDLREYYEFHKKKCYVTCGGEHIEHVSKVTAIKYTLSALGIAIEGINA